MYGKYKARINRMVTSNGNKTKATMLKILSPTVILYIE